MGPITVAFRDYYDVERIIGREYLLKGSRYGVERDYPKDINNARRLLWSRYKEQKETKHRNDTVKLQNTAMLVVNGKVVEDAFPGWSEALKIIRVEPYEPSQDKTNKMICAPSEYSDQPGHPPSLIRVFAVRMKKHWVLSYPFSALRRLIRLGGCPG